MQSVPMWHCCGKEKDMLNNRQKSDLANLEADINDVSLDRFPTKVTLTLSFTVLCAALTLSFLISGLADATMLTSWITCLASSAIFFNTSKKISQAVWKVLGLALAVSFFGSPVIPALFLGCTVAVGAYSSLIVSSKGRAILTPVLLPVIAYGLSCIIGGNPIFALTALIPFIPAIPMGLYSRKDAGITTAIVSAATTMLLIVIGTAALAVRLFYGELSSAAVDSAVRDITNLFLTYCDQTFAELEGFEYNESIRKEFALAIEVYINSAIGIVMAACTVIAFMAARTQNALFEAYGLDEHLTSKSTTVTVSVIAAAIFVISMILSFSLDSSNNTSIVGIVSSNLCLALTPGLAFMGFRAIKELPHRLGGFGTVISIVLVIVTLFFTMTYPAFIAIVGAIYVVALAIDVWAKNFYSKGDNR